MGNEEVVTPSKSDKASSPVQDQPVVHSYPDWTAMQAYYGSGVPMPPPFFNTTVARGHPPHPYMWSLQPVMPSFATPYPAIYPHGVYPHPALVSPSTTDVTSKSSSTKDWGLMKKIKGFDSLAVSIGNVNAEIAVEGSGLSQSGENGAEGSSDVSDENNVSEGKESQGIGSSEGTPTSGVNKNGILTSSNATADVSEVVIVSPSTINCKPICTMSASTQLKAGAHPEPWTQDERELKREKRKQSNRESARRSRLRKQAETEELALKVETLSAENTSLRSEITHLRENLDKIRAENSSLMAELKNVEENSSVKLEDQEAPSIVAENFLSRIDEPRQDESRENSKGVKLHQLLDANPRTDPVSAG